MRKIFLKLFGIIIIISWNEQQALALYPIYTKITCSSPPPIVGCAPFPQVNQVTFSPVTVGGTTTSIAIPMTYNSTGKYNNNAPYWRAQTFPVFTSIAGQTTVTLTYQNGPSPSSAGTLTCTPAANQPTTCPTGQVIYEIAINFSIPDANISCSYGIDECQPASVSKPTQHHK